jgi:hypothetical protein
MTTIKKTQQSSLVKLTNKKEMMVVESGLMQYANVIKSIPINNSSSVVHIIDKCMYVREGVSCTNKNTHTMLTCL